MANYTCHTRSNYFKVKDESAFNAFCSKYSLRRINQDNLVGFVVDDDYGICAEDDQDFDRDLAGTLDEGQVAIIQEVGHAKMRFLDGYSVAVNWKGESVTVNLSDIYEKAKTLAGPGISVTECRY